MPKQSKPTSDKQITTKSDIKKKRLIQLWKDTRGHVSDMCSAANVTRKTFYKWLKVDKEFNQDIQDAEWGLHDEVRDALIQKIADGSSSDIQFYLKKRHPQFKDKKIKAARFDMKQMKVEFIDYEG